MKNQVTYSTFLIFLVLLVLYSCTKMSPYYEDTTAGLNGGFEITKNGQPVNWVFYNTKTVPEGDFEIRMDTANKKEGKQSLKFDIKACASDGGRLSPGFTNEFFDKKEGRYRLSFWLMNQDTAFSIHAGGVTSKGGNMKNIVRSSEQIEKWQLFEYIVDVPKGAWLRIEINLLKPGVFWIDDLKIKEI